MWVSILLACEHTFVEREWLQARLAEGLSLEQIGALAGRDGSTVGYWVHKHGLEAAHAERYTARGAPDRQVLESLAARGVTLGEMAAAIDRSVTTVRYWLRAWGIERAGSRDAWSPGPLQRLWSASARGMAQRHSGSRAVAITGACSVGRSA